mgnify:CR=1 FL=1
MKKVILWIFILFSVFLLAWCQNKKNSDVPKDAVVGENGLVKWEMMIDGEVYAGEELQQKILEEQFEWVDEDYELVRELEDGEDDKKSGGKAKGSCDAIADSSTCIEYYGSFWTEQQMKLQCQWAGTFSKKWCPSDMAWWCNTAMWTQADMVAWMYLRWGGEIDAEWLKYAKMACDATMASKWIETK